MIRHIRTMIFGTILGIVLSSSASAAAPVPPRIVQIPSPLPRPETVVQVPYAGERVQLPNVKIMPPALLLLMEVEKLRP